MMQSLPLFSYEQCFFMAIYFLFIYNYWGFWSEPAKLDLEFMGFFCCCKCILAQMKMIQLALFWLDQNCRIFQSKIDHFLVFEKWQSILPIKNLQFWSNQKSPNCMIWFGPFYIYIKKIWFLGQVWLVHFWRNAYYM